MNSRELNTERDWNDQPVVLQVNKISKEFGGVRAVDELSLTISHRTVTGLIGPNGAGKSTVINLLTGLLAVSGGSATFRGQDITAASAHVIARCGLGRTFQTSRLFEDLSVTQNIEVARRFGDGRGQAGWSRRRADGRSVAELLLLLELRPVADHPASVLSYGHRRRLEIARALALRPELLLLDEPVAGMHDGEAAEIAELLKRVAGEGVAVLVVEHNMRFISAVAECLYVLDHGRLIAEGSPEAVLANPAVIAAYLGSDHA